MDQNRLDDLESRVDHLEEGNGWHEWGKYVLKKLDTIELNQKENRKELCGKIGDLEGDNTIAHRELHRKLDAQKSYCAERPLICGRNWLSSKTFYWVVGGIVAFMMLIGGLALSNKDSISSLPKKVEAAQEQPLDSKK